MRLLRVEASRFASRRAVVLLVLAAAVLTGLLAGSRIWDTRAVSASDLADARAQVEQTTSQPDFQEELKTCREDPETFFGPGASADDCEANLVPTPEAYLGRATLDLRAERDGTGIALIVLVAALMIIVGTTFAGGDWSTGSISNQLLFEPRRTRVWAAKAVVALLGTALVSTLLLTGLWSAMAITADVRGITTPSGVWHDIVWEALRGVALASAGGLGGYAMTMLLRHTVGTLALLFAYAAGGEALLAILPFDGTARFSPTSNVFAWLRDGVRVFDQSLVCTPQQGPTCDQRLLITMAEGASYLGVLLVLTLVVSLLLFRRRDVP